MAGPFLSTKLRSTLVSCRLPWNVRRPSGSQISRSLPLGRIVISPASTLFASARSRVFVAASNVGSSLMLSHEQVIDLRAHRCIRCDVDAARESRRLRDNCFVEAIVLRDGCCERRVVASLPRSRHERFPRAGRWRALRDRCIDEGFALLARIGGTTLRGAVNGFLCGGTARK